MKYHTARWYYLPYKSKMLNETKYNISIEASTTDYWKKYIGENGMAFGIDDFGK